MRKILTGLTIILMGIILSLLLTGCNKQVFDFNYTFDYAIIELPNGEVVEGKIQSWTDYEDGEQLQIKIDDVMYLTNSYKCTLIKH